MSVQPTEGRGRPRPVSPKSACPARASPPSAQFWRQLEQIAARAHVTAFWRARLGEDLAAFVPCLRRTPGLAAGYPCPRDCGCVHEVVPESDGVFAAVCRCEPWTCDTLLLHEEDVALWEVNWSRLGRALCAALSLDSRPASLGLPGTEQIGAWSAAAVPVLLTVQTHAAALQRVMAGLGARLRHPYILLTPTKQQVTAAALELLDGARAGLFDLESTVRLLPSGRFEPLQRPGELFSSCTPAPPETDRSVVERAFALLKTLDGAGGRKPPSLTATFSHYCLDGWNVSEIAVRYRCSRGSVLNRLSAIRQRTGVDPDQFRRLSPALERAEKQISDPRARSIYRKGAIYGDAPDEEE